MKIKTFFLILTCLALHGNSLFAQASTPGNFPIAGTNYLGWDATTTQDLNIKHEGPYPIIFSTDQSERMRLTENGQLLIGTSVPLGVSGATRLEVHSQGSTVAIGGRAEGASGTNVGGYFQATGGTTSYGAVGQAFAGSANLNFGVRGEACGAATNYGVFGQSCEEPDSWAGFFNGPTFSPGGVWTASDSQLKTNISAIENATELLMAIHPKSYDFVQDVPGLNLPGGLQYGVLSQELAEVVPHAVTQFSSPPVLDDEMNIIHAPEQYQGVNYTQLIPLLIAGFKEQQISQSEYEAKHGEALEKMAELQDELKQLNRNAEIRKGETGSTGATLRQNVPNPFAQHTEIQYDLSFESQVTLEITDASGRTLKVLASGHHETGPHRVEWDASQYSSGVYYCILRNENQLETIKLIKK